MKIVTTLWRYKKKLFCKRTCDKYNEYNHSLDFVECTTSYSDILLQNSFLKGEGIVLLNL